MLDFMEVLSTVGSVVIIFLGVFACIVIVSAISATIFGSSDNDGEDDGEK